MKKNLYAEIFSYEWSNTQRLVLTQWHKVTRKWMAY